MAKPKMTWNDKGFEEVLKGTGPASEVRAALERIRAAAGPGHTISVRQNRERVSGIIYTSSSKAKRAEAKDRNLTRAFGAGRK